METQPTRKHPGAPQLEIRTADSHDVPALEKLVNAAYRGESGRRGWTTESDLLAGQRVDEELIHALIAEDESMILVAMTPDAQIRGCVHLKRNSTTTSYLGMLTTDVDSQAAGIGTQLLRAAEAHARAIFRSSEMEMTVIDVRSELISWYQRRGYHLTGEKRPFPSENPRFGVPLIKALCFSVLKRSLKH